MPTDEINSKSIYQKCNSRAIKSLEIISEFYKKIIEALIAEKRKKLIKARKDLIRYQKDDRNFTIYIYGMISVMEEKDIDNSGDHFILILDLLSETAQHLDYIISNVYQHVENNHEPLITEEAEIHMSYTISYTKFLDQSRKFFSEESFHDFRMMNDMVQVLLSELVKMRKSHLERLRSDPLSPGASILYLDMLGSSQSMILVIYKLFSAFN